MKPRLLDLFCGAGGCSVGYERAGFDVVGVDIAPQKHYRGGTFVQADALAFVREHWREFDAVHASPPCQAHSSLKHVVKATTGRVHADLIPATREALVATGKPYVIENVPGAPLGGGDAFLVMLCGTMFGLQTPDRSAEIRRHRLFELNWCPGLRPACQHGGSTLCVVGSTPEDRSGPRQENGRRLTPARGVITVAGEHPHSAAVRHANRKQVVLTVAGHDYHSMAARNRRRAITVTGATPQTNVVHNTERETFTVDEARAAMGIPWMPMSRLSQAIPPTYTEWLGRRLLAFLREESLTAAGAAV